MQKDLIKQRRRPKQLRAIQKYNEILDASARVLQEQGYSQSTMQEISLESGHPYSTIYQYFSSKDDIYLAWLERFINYSLYGLSNLILANEEAELDDYVDAAVQLALEQTIAHQQILSTLFGNMPMLTTKLVELMEMRTLLWVKEAFGLDIHADSQSREEQNLLTTIRAGNGYWLQLALNTEREINLERESQNFSALVKALLRIH